ncbi:MAG: Succinate dehydrogenase, cytochrome b subunit [uncultured bacterium]|nr:MAG: Succinate dehydrogenase, cytochrome b subunit [uncultured bacterium]OFW70076.1 MAG: succinate dehydrogenase, cytochrome b556 subunit [Alphaproteobacteria bacterium GWC2_42_16]OFW74576.1 MAG: succinate dehydrogenase, cytochrome b556 subunit [Alphaproteobacteria bacterium GWA2_41_27]OFW84848.1 MAG: succinate dehydrogenase, cytochrome b556 subunit [Alphaproteobacteria bacterium RIFCSPHIGHO2_12_FULL_42_100]OFW86573.1 MAG: succinate dehydrogenase, cytochrome b556 subunit [Alphaproteobacteria
MPLSQEEINRPLSPHLLIYKPQITSVLSIMHRGTGIVLFGGSLLWALWFVLLAAGSTAYIQGQTLLLSPFGLIILLGWSFSFFYHFCNGIRHLLWDIGVGFELSTVRKSGWTVIFASIFLTSVAWALGVMNGKGLL